jgi:hypothetical protein
VSPSRKKLGGILTVVGGVVIYGIDAIGRIQTTTDIAHKLLGWIPFISGIHFPIWPFGLLIAACGVLIYVWPEVQVDQDPTPGEKSPQLVATTFTRDFTYQARKNVFLLHVRNDAISPQSTARNVVAHIGYRDSSGSGMQVDYGAWMENAPTIDIERGQTKRLIIALADEDKNFAVNFTGPRTNFRDPMLVSAGELVTGSWRMLVTINAENYTKEFRFILTVEKDGAIGCLPEPKTY